MAAMKFCISMQLSDLKTKQINSEIPVVNLVFRSTTLAENCFSFLWLFVPVTCEDSVIVLQSFFYILKKKDFHL